MCAGVREDGSVIEANDPFWADLTQQANAAKDDPLAWIGQEQFYGDLAQNQHFADRFAHWLTQVWTHGTEAAIRTYLDN